MIVFIHPRLIVALLRAYPLMRKADHTQVYRMFGVNGPEWHVAVRMAA